MNGQPSSHDRRPTAPDTPVDTGSQALSEALRSSFAIVRVVMIALVVVFLASGFFTVGPQERAIILRFGRPVGEGEKALLGEGAHWAWPYPIDEVVRVPITEIQSVTSTVGWYAETPEQQVTGAPPPNRPSLNPAVDGYGLTADTNIVHSRATLYYRINDPIRHVFGFVSASNVVQNALNNALLFTAAHFKVDDILTSEIAAFREAVTKRVTELVEKEDAGVAVDHCEVLSIPPFQLSQAFKEVINAGQNRSKTLNEALGEANQITNKASSDATALVNSAEVARTNLIASLTAEADWFRGLLPKYEASPDLFVQTRMVETLSRVLTNVQDKIYLPTTAEGKPVEMRLLLNRELPKPNAGAPPP